MSQMIGLWGHLDKKRRVQFFLLLLLSVFSSFIEVISIGAVLPFLGVLVSPDKVFELEFSQPLIVMLGASSPGQLIFPITIIFISAALIAGIIRLTLIYSMTRLSYAAGADLSVKIYRRTLYQDYSIHLNRNSSEVINGIINKTAIVISGVITPFLNLISGVILLVGVMTTLLVIDAAIAIAAFTIFGLLYLGIILFTKRSLNRNSALIASESTQIIKFLQEGLGGIRDVLIDGSQEYYCKLYQKSDLPLRRASGDNSFISTSPRFAMEAIGISLIAILAYIMSQRVGGISSAIPSLGALAMGAQRLLPTLQIIYASVSTLRGSKSSFEDVLDLLNQPIHKNSNDYPKNPISFKKDIKLSNLSFQYLSGTKWILKDVNLTLDKGKLIGFMGPTGVGKSTLLDVIMGLLPPTKGALEIDGQPISSDNNRSWQSHIAHVPQSVFLSDASIAENIAFGVPAEEINHDRVKLSAKRAQLSELIDQWPQKYETFVGERGALLSGGQRQRIGIARALYKKADVLIFDEATSSLDTETEESVMKSIEGLSSNLTILIIAHRLTTLKNCSQIIKLEKNGNFHIGDYNSVTK